jgi:hypothetical protein
MLKDHKIKIEQEEHWTKIILRDKEESKAGGGFISGTWQHTKESYNGKEIVFTTDNPEHYYFEWRGPHGGPLRIGVKMNSPSSHKQGEKPYFQVLITLDHAKRTAGSHFEVTSVMDEKGTGSLTYNVNPHFTKGDILWSTEYD